MPWWEWELSEGDHDEEEVEEDREDDCNCPECVPGLEQLSGEKEVGECVDGGKSHTKDKNFSNEESICRLHYFTHCLLLKPNINVTNWILN